MKARLLRVLGLLARVAVAAGIIAWLLRRIGLESFAGSLRDTLARWPWLAAGHCLILAALATCVVRWRVILNAQGMTLGPWRLGGIFLIGLFFNGFMVGTTGGDLVKAYYIARETHHKKTEAVATIFIDRIIGFLAQFALVAVLILARAGFLLRHPVTAPWCITVLALCVLSLAASVVAFRTHLFERPSLLRWAQQEGRMGRFARALRRVYDAFYVCRCRPKLLVWTAVLSLLNQVLAAVATMAFGRALGVHIRFVDYLAFIPLVGLIASIPVTPGGLGLREGLTIYLLHSVNVLPEDGFLLGFLPYLSLLVWGVAGVAPFLFMTGVKGRRLHEEMAAIAESGGAEPSDEAPGSATPPAPPPGVAPAPAGRDPARPC